MSLMRSRSWRNDSVRVFVWVIVAVAVPYLPKNLDPPIGLPAPRVLPDEIMPDVGVIER